METALKSQILNKLERLPRSRMLQVLDYIEFILVKTRLEQNSPIEASDKEILRAIEATGALDFYYDKSQDVYTLEDGEPLRNAAILF